MFHYYNHLPSSDVLQGYSAYPFLWNLELLSKDKIWGVYFLGLYERELPDAGVGDGAVTL